MTLWLLLKRITVSCLLLCDQNFHHLSQISPWTADCRHHFHSECADDGGCQANVSWTSTAPVCTLSPLKGLMRNLASALHSLFQAQFAAFWLPSKDQRQILCGGKPVHFASSSQLADWRKSSQIQFITLFIIQVSALKPWLEWDNHFGNKQGNFFNHYLH